LSAKPDADSAKAPAKSKKLLVIVGAVVVILALAAGGGWFYISKQRAAAAAEADGEEEVVTKAAPEGPPTFLPLDNMVVNLADPGGEKVAQIGVILQVTDSHASDTVKLYLPAIRSGVLLLISQRTAEELLQREGKDKLAADILAEASKPWGGVEESHDAPAADGGKAKPKKKKAKKSSHGENPVVGVLFSSFIVQ
jgi:flagellar FliL protein